MAAVAACGGIALVVSVSAGGATGPSGVRITDLQISYNLVRPQDGGQTGAVETITQRLFKPPAAKPIGNSLIVCTYASKRDRSCVGTYVLPKGNLVVAGALQSRLLYEVPVVGGTGLYDNARGTLTVTATHLRPRHEVLVFRLVG